MADAEALHEVAVVVWRSSADAVLVEPEPATVVVDFSGESALPAAIAAIEAGLGRHVAIRRLTETEVHVELLDEDGDHLSWSDADPARVGGHQPWYRAGWYSATADLIGSTLKDLGASSTGRPVQHKHWSISALVSVDTTDGVFWFKQVPPLMAHEGSLVQWLAKLRPTLVPEVVATGPDWALTRAFPSGGAVDPLDSPFDALAELQMAATDHAGELLAVGCPDRRLPVLRDDLAQLVTRADLIAEPVREQLSAALPAVERLVAELDDCGIGSTVVHGDLHGGNAVRRPDGSWLIFDWTDGCLAHPFMDLGVISSRDADVRRARVEQYAAAWRALGIRAEAVARADRAADPLAAGFHAISYQRIVDGLEFDDAAEWKPVVTSYLKRLIELA